MDRISDKQLDDFIEFYTTWSTPLGAALTELRERRASDQYPLEPMDLKGALKEAADAQKHELSCPICGRHHNIGNPCYKIK